jgi:uncharacterized protein
MISRLIQSELRRVAAEYKVITITGPRQSGKTTLARMEFPSYGYVNLEDPEIRVLAQTDPREFLRRHSAPLILDEIQRVPSLLSYIQTIVDASDQKAMFILTGSHQPALKAGISQSLAGRTAILELLPLSLAELRDAGIMQDRDECIFKGFMPQLYAESLDVTRFYRNYYMTYIERDARQLINVRNLSAFDTFIRLLAGRVGQLLNLNSLANDVGVSSTTLSQWLSTLEASHILFRLPPYFENFGKRLTKSPKIYFTEVGLASYLLGLESPEMVSRDPLLGGLFENLVVLEALKARYNAGKDADLYFYRDSQGVEVDLLLAVRRKLFPLEIKAARTFSSDFLKNLRKFRLWSGDKSMPGKIVYAGDKHQKVGDAEVLNFADLSDVITRDSMPS